jgi:signal transduction histidine kinase
MRHPTAEQLRPIDLFDGLEDGELEHFAAAAELRELAPGAMLSELGVATSTCYFVLTGSLEASVVDGQGRYEPVGQHPAPTWVGAIPTLTGGNTAVRLRAMDEATVAGISREPFIELVLAHRTVFDRIMRQVRPVVGRITAMEQNRERLAGLGTMAAGLAHELNNPAAAAQRAAADLAEALEVLSSTVGLFVESGVERSEAEALVALQRDALKRRTEFEALSAVQAADCEDEVLDALDALGIPDAWRLAEPLASAGVDGPWLERLQEYSGKATEAAVRWIAASLNAQSLAADLAASTRQMSQLVAAVKAYAYMDRGGPIEADVHEGLETTITVMKHKLKSTHIELVRDYEHDLPKIVVHAGELNQVWTNLIHNAIQALGDSGTLTITTRRDGPCIRVDVADTGPGIDPAVRERIFEPFFTTKEVGQGTGLGLDTARRIVVDRHHGSITVESQPGHTVFHVWLPLSEPLAKTAERAA